MQIRAKEASRAKACITRDPVVEKRLEMLARFPDLIRVIRTFYIAERKAAMPFEDVAKKLAESCSNLPLGELEGCGLRSNAGGVWSQS